MARHTPALDVRGLATDNADYPSDATDFLRGYESGRFRPERLLGGSGEYRVLPVAKFSEAAVAVLGFLDGSLRSGTSAATSVPGTCKPTPAWASPSTCDGFSNHKVLPGYSLGSAFCPRGDEPR